MTPCERVKCETCGGTGKLKGTRRAGLMHYVWGDDDRRKNRHCNECWGNGFIMRPIPAARTAKT